MGKLGNLGIAAALACTVGCVKFEEEVGTSASASTALDGLHYQGLNLQGLNLQGLNLQGLNLQGLNLQGLNLQGLNLQGLNLQGLNLQGLNLQGLNLQGTALVGIGVDGFEHPPEDLIGIEVEATLVDVDGVTATIILVIKDVVQDERYGHDDVWLYEIVQRTTETESVVVNGIPMLMVTEVDTPLCPASPEDDRDDHKAVLLAGTWNELGIHQDDPAFATIGCTIGRLSKCTRWEDGLKRHLGFEEGHDACVLAAAAAVFGIDYPGFYFTKEGSLIDFADWWNRNTFSNVDVIYDGNIAISGEFEAAYKGQGADRGAVCLNTMRLEDYAAQAAIADCELGDIDCLIDYLIANFPDLPLTAAAIAGRAGMCKDAETARENYPESVYVRTFAKPGDLVFFFEAANVHNFGGGVGR